MTDTMVPAATGDVPAPPIPEPLLLTLLPLPLLLRRSAVSESKVPSKAENVKQRLPCSEDDAIAEDTDVD